MSAEDFDAGAFASVATGEDPDTGAGAENHAEAEGAEASGTIDVGGRSTWKEMALATDPSRSLDEVESPWDPEKGGITRIYRGIMKATDVDGLPAIADVVIGVAEWVTTLDVDANGGGDGQDDGADFGGTV